VSLRQLYIAQSLDGYIADEDGGVEWLEKRGEGGDFGYDAFFSGVGALAMGAKTYEQLLSWGVWPYAEVPTWIFTHRDLGVPDGADVRFTDRPAREVVPDMDAAAGGKNVWLVGGGGAAKEWIDDRLLDELILFVVPLLLGDGVRLFGETAQTDLELTESKAYPNGFVELRYRLERSA